MFTRSAVALAASVMIVIGIARFVRTDHSTPRAAPTPVQIVVHERRVAIGRPPTKLETAILTSQLKQKERIAAAPVPPPRSISRSAKATIVQKVPESVDVFAISRELSKPDLPTERRQVLLVTLLNDASVESIRVYLDSVAKGATKDVSLAALDGVRDPPVDRFIAALRDPLVERRIAAARALGYIDGPALTSRLIRMAEKDESRREAMIALACSRGEAAQRYVDRAATSGPLLGLARSVRVQFDTR